MKKSLIFVGMLAIVYANAQQGNVGINVEQPKATLDINPNVDNAKTTSTTNQGILAPRLSKTRIANIADTNLVEGTLVYATDNTYTGANTKVSKITEKGYYFYNGTEWVKVSTTNAVASNIYTADGTLTADRRITMDGKKLYMENGGVGITGSTTEYLPFIVNAMHSEGNGGIGIQPKGDASKRVELDTTPEGNFRLWAGDDRFYVNRATGNVGIGNNNSPKSKLDVDGGIRVLQGLPNGDDTNLGYSFGHDGDTGLFSEKGTSDNTAKNLILSANNSPRIYIDAANGNVGIGTIEPKEKLDVMGGDIQVSGSNVGEWSNAIQINQGDYYAYFKIDPEQRMVFGNSANKGYKFINGNVGINQNNPLFTLDVEGNSRIMGTSDHLFRIQKSNSNYITDLVKRENGTFIITNGTQSNIWSEGLAMDKDGKIGIGTESPNEKLQINGAVRIVTTQNECTSENLGTIKFENDNFYGCKSTGWVRLNN